MQLRAYYAISHAHTYIRLYIASEPDVTGAKIGDLVVRNEEFEFAKARIMADHWTRLDNMPNVPEVDLRKAPM